MSKSRHFECSDKSSNRGFDVSLRFRQRSRAARFAGPIAFALILIFADAHPVSADVANRNCEIYVSRGSQKFPIGSFSAKGRYYIKPKWYQTHGIASGLKAGDIVNARIRACAGDAINSRSIPASCIGRRSHGRSGTGHEAWSEINNYTIVNLKENARRKACNGSASSGQQFAVILDNGPGNGCIAQLWVLWRERCPSARPAPPPPPNLPPASSSRGQSCIGGSVDWAGACVCPQGTTPQRDPIWSVTRCVSNAERRRATQVACYNGRVSNGQCICRWGFKRQLIGPNAYNCVRRGQR